jgi:hypothetical protein
LLCGGPNLQHGWLVPTPRKAQDFDANALFDLACTYPLLHDFCALPSDSTRLDSIVRRLKPPTLQSTISRDRHIAETRAPLYSRVIKRPRRGE